MAFTMHSHSGQFCPGHAKDSLEDIIRHAIKMGFKSMGLTEHMPRTAVEDLYPEELTPSPSESLATLHPRHTSYLAEATRLQTLFSPQISLLVGFETEWLRPDEYIPLITTLAADPRIDYLVGSVHHVDSIPIDFDAPTYARAVAAHSGSEEALFTAYFDAQHDMLQALQPRVVGHFDLIRLFSSYEAQRATLPPLSTHWPGVWERILRNLRAAHCYGGWLELNTSALRKGLAEAYPMREIAEAWVGMGGKFTVSDDSHGVGQVGTNYGRGLGYLEELGVREVWTLERKEGGGVVERGVAIGEFRGSLKEEGSA
ncbi:Polymerase/histidinol phosphatase-like protein [Staphylotrichum tortipilum]|uniref:Histidinol-phosphatase n=1 Tax=Staphylotrichum tortipilum TaxID=2831512 RepID=A0AAN6MSH0_9PEZI|nr:Polymerase/histidinol phosphatase-like protein [Staphylotrichum longicolle]